MPNPELLYHADHILGIQLVFLEEHMGVSVKCFLSKQGMFLLDVK